MYYLYSLYAAIVTFSVNNVTTIMHEKHKKNVCAHVYQKTNQATPLQ